jgi:hypothetical protein
MLSNGFGGDVREKVATSWCAGFQLSHLFVLESLLPKRWVKRWCATGSAGVFGSSSGARACPLVSFWWWSSLRLQERVSRSWPKTSSWLWSEAGCFPHTANLSFEHAKAEGPWPLACKEVGKSQSSYGPAHTAL